MQQKQQQNDAEKMRKKKTGTKTIEIQLMSLVSTVHKTVTPQL